MEIHEIIAIAGGVGKLAQIAEVHYSTVSGWRYARIPIERAKLIHARLSIPLHEIRPDVWTPPAVAAE